MNEEKRFLIPAADIIYFEDGDIDTVTSSGVLDDFDDSEVGEN